MVGYHGWVGVVEGTHEILEELPCFRMKMSMGHLMVRTPLLEMGCWVMGVIGMRGGCGEVLDEVSGVMEGNHDKLGLDRCEHGLPDCERMKPGKKGLEMRKVEGKW